MAAGWVAATSEAATVTRAVGRVQGERQQGRQQGGVIGFGDRGAAVAVAKAATEGDGAEGGCGKVGGDEGSDESSGEDAGKATR